MTHSISDKGEVMATESVDELDKILKQFWLDYISSSESDPYDSARRQAKAALQAYVTRECARKVLEALMKATMSLPSLQDAKVTLPPGLAGEQMKWRQGFKAGVNAVEAELRAAIEEVGGA